MASFFYADIKTDELQVHGHNPSIPAQIELFDASASNIITLKAPTTLSQPAVSITLPSSVANTNSLMMNTGGTGVLELITPSGDLSMANYGAFTLNSISNTTTVTSAANISLASGRQLNLGATANIGYDANTNIILSGSNQVIAKLGGQQVFTATYTGGNALINMGSISGESGIGFKNTSDGQIQVRPNTTESWTDLATHLANLSDVQLSGLANNNALLYNSTTGKWFNSQFDGALGYYGSFYDTSIQTNAGATAANAMRFNTTAEAHGVSIVNNSNVTVSHTGVYNIQFSAQLENLTSGTHDINIWLAKNGINESNTDTKITLSGNNAKSVAAWNFVLTLNANDYVILYWASTETQVQLTAIGTDVNPTRPAIPSVILTVTQMINIQDSTLRMGDLLNVNDTAKTGNSIIQFNSGTNQYEAVSNLAINTGNLINFGTTANISAPVSGNLTLQGSNIDLIIPSGNEVHVHNNLRVTGTLYMDGNNNSNISAPTASNLNLRAGNINLTGTQLISCTGNVSIGQNNFILFGSTSNISAPVTGNLDINSGNVNIIANGKIVNRVAGQPVFSATYNGGNALINMGSTSGESGIGFKNISGGQIQVKPNSSSSWSNIVTHLSNLGDVTVTSPANTNALLYNSGTSSWTNRQIALNDISQVSVSGQTSNQALFYNGTNFMNRSPLYTDLTGNVTVLPFLASNVRICDGAGVGGQTQRCIAIGHSAGAGGQAGGAIAIGWLAGTAGQGSRCIAIGTAAQSIGSQPNYSMVLNSSATSVNALQESSTYIAPLRNVNTSNVVMYNPSTYEMTYGSRDYFTLTMFGELNNTYVAATSTLKFLFSLNSTYWDVAPNASASPPSLTQYSSGSITYNTSNGIIELNSTKNYYMDLDVQLTVNYDTTATMVMELVKNPVTSNTILCTSKLEASASVDYVYYTLPMKTIIQTASNIRINVYKSTAAGTATLLAPDCQITMFLQEI